MVPIRAPFAKSREIVQFQVLHAFDPFFLLLEVLSVESLNRVRYRRYRASRLAAY